MNRKAYLLELTAIYSSLPEPSRPEFMHIMAEREKNPVLAFGWNAFFGWLGLDKFYLGQPLLGIVKLVTLGMFGLWVILDLFIVAGDTREINIKAAHRLRASHKA